MATSGTQTFDLSVEELISKAMELAGGEIVSGDDLKQARTSLNLLLIDMQNRGHPLAELEKKTLTLASASSSYPLSAGIMDVMDVVVTRSSVTTPLQRMNIFEYHKIPVKTQTGLPTQYAIDRDRDNITMELYLTPDQNDTLSMWVLTEIEDVGVNYNNELDVNRVYLPALVFGLAYFIVLSRVQQMGEQGLILMNELKSNYIGALDAAATEDRQRSSFTLTPWSYKP